MSKFVEATDSLKLSIEIEGEKKEITLEKEEYYLLERSKDNYIPVIKHDALVRIAEANGVKIDQTFLEFGQFHNPNNFCFIHRAIKKLEDGSIIDEVGEANPKNLDTAIGGAYPAIMSNKRAQDRLLIRLMGLQGQVYSDVEFSSVSTADKEDEIIEIPVEEAKELIVDYGAFRKAPITLIELMEKFPKDFDWLLNNYRIGPKSSEKMKLLHFGARTLAKHYAKTK